MGYNLHGLPSYVTRKQPLIQANLQALCRVMQFMTGGYFSTHNCVKTKAIHQSDKMSKQLKHRSVLLSTYDTSLTSQRNLTSNITNVYDQMYLVTQSILKTPPSNYLQNSLPASTSLNVKQLVILLLIFLYRPHTLTGKCVTS